MFHVEHLYSGAGRSHSLMRSTLRTGGGAISTLSEIKRFNKRLSKSGHPGP